MSVYLEAKKPIGGLTKLVFPFTPQIEYSADVKYDTYNTTHTNYQLNGYIRTDNPVISMTCKFSAHTTEHFKISEFALRFLRTYTKMNYGRQDYDRGQTPRILRFFAHGNSMFNNVPVVINKFSMTFPEDVDYVKGSIGNNGDMVKNAVVKSTQVPTTALANNQVTENSVSGSVYLPILFSINIGLLLQQNMYDAVTAFKLEDFALGKLSSKGYI